MIPSPEAVVRGEPFAVRRGRRVSAAVRSAPARSAPAVLFVHGAGGNMDQWRELWRPLAEDGLHLLALDSPGHGASPVPRRPEAYATDALADDLLALAAAHAGGRPLTVVGHSYGTVVALTFIARLAQAGRSSEVSGVLLLAAPPPAFRFSGPLLEEPLSKLRRMRPLLEHGFREAAWGRDADPALVDHEERLARRNRLSMMRMLMRGARPPDPSELAAVTNPVLILAGEEDRLTPPDGARALADALPEARIRVLAGCGHQVMLERPNETLAALRELLAT